MDKWQITISFEPGSVEKLVMLRDRTDAPDVEHVIRGALGVYWSLFAMVNTGKTLMVRDTAGQIDELHIWDEHKVN